MRLKKVIIKGFMRFKDRVEIEFPHNQVTLIAGENGAGKTSILDAVCLCFYGKTFRTSGKTESGFLKMQDLVNHDSDKAIVEVEFENYGHNYVVTREITSSKSTGKLFEDGDPKAIDKAVYDYIRKFAIGLDWEGFRKSTVILQGEMSSLTQADPAERKRSFMKLFGLERYIIDYDQLAKNMIDDKTIAMDKIKEVNKVLLEEVQKIPLLKKGLKKIERKIHRLEKRKSDLTKNFDERKKEKESLEGDYQKYSILKERLANLDDAIKKLKAEITKRKREVSRLQRMKNRLPIIEKTYNEFVKLQESIDKLKPLKNKFDKLSAHLSELNISKEGKEKELSEAQEELEKTKSEIARLEKQIPSCMEANKVEKELKEIEKKKTKFEKRKAALEADIRTAKKLIKDLRRKLNEVKGKRKCPVCLQLIKDPSQVNKHYNEEITNLLSQQVKNRKILKNVELELGEAVKKFGELNIARNNLRDRFNKRQLVARETKALRRLGKREKRIDKLIQTLNAKMEKQRAIIVSLNFDEKGYSNIEARLSELRKQKISEKYVNVKTQLERLPEATEAVITSMKELNVLNDQRKGLHGEIISFGDIEKNYERVKRSFESVQKAMEENKVKLAEENISRSSGKKQLTELLEKKTSVEDNKKKIRELEKERLLLEELRNVFKNIPENILRRLRPYIEKEGNDIITDLSDGEITALNIEEETLNVAATMLGEVRPIHYFSEGQKTRINMSLRVAISRILSKLPQTEEHAYAVMQTLFVDEGDFGSLDESGIRDAVAVIRNLTREFDRVIVISHVSAIKEIFQGRMLEVIKIGSEESVVKSFGVTPELTEEIVSAK